MIEIIPGILEQDFAEIKRKIRLVEPYVKWVQIDVLDGSLFNNSCLHEAEPFADLDSPLLREVHLMVKNPVLYVEPFFAAGFDRFIAHIEGFVETGEETENVYDFIHVCRTHEAQIALAVDLPTPIETVFPYLESLDQVLMMTIPTGRSGQSFHYEALSKIKALHRLAPHIPIEVDGGINLITAPLVVAAGATLLAATSSIFGNKDAKEAIEELKKSGETMQKYPIE